MKTGKERKADMTARMEAGESAEKIGREYGVSRQCVHNIVNGNNRTSVSEARVERVSRRCVLNARRYLSDQPSTLFLRLGEVDWSIGKTRHAGSQELGTYTAAISPSELHADVEAVAAEMAKQFQRRAA
jgi:predicted transcriptional regulator